MLEKLLKGVNLGDVGIVLIAAIAIIGVWRGVWNLMDKYLFPGNFLMSQIVSIAVGILILVILSKWK